MASVLAEENKDFENYLNEVDVFCKKPTKELVESICYNIDKRVIPKQNKKKKIYLYSDHYYAFIKI